MNESAHTVPFVPTVRQHLRDHRAVRVTDRCARRVDRELLGQVTGQLFRVLHEALLELPDVAELFPVRTMGSVSVQRLSERHADGERDH